MSIEVMQELSRQLRGKPVDEIARAAITALAKITTKMAELDPEDEQEMAVDFTVIAVCLGALIKGAQDNE